MAENEKTPDQIIDRLRSELEYLEVEIYQVTLCPPDGSVSIHARGNLRDRTIDKIMDLVKGIVI